MLLGALLMILNIGIAVYFAKKKWRRVSDIYLIFIAIMFLLWLFSVDIPEIQTTIRGYLGAELYSDFVYVLTLQDGISPLVAVHLVSIIVAVLISFALATDVIRYIRAKRERSLHRCAPLFIEIADDVVGSDKVKKYALFCSYLC